jgi:hypothetical protein
MITNDARCAHEIKSRIAMAKEAFDKNKAIFTSKLDLSCYIWSIALYGAERHTLQKLVHKCLGSFEVKCRRRMKKIGWTEYVKHEDVFYRVKEVRNILHTLKGGKFNCIGHISRRNCLIKHSMEGRREGLK